VYYTTQEKVKFFIISLLITVAVIGYLYFGLQWTIGLIYREKIEAMIEERDFLIEEIEETYNIQIDKSDIVSLKQYATTSDALAVLEENKTRPERNRCASY